MGSRRAGRQDGCTDDNARGGRDYALLGWCSDPPGVPPPKTPQRVSNPAFFVVTAAVYRGRHANVRGLVHI